MAKPDAASQYLSDFLDRTRRAREAAGFTQQQLATLLGMEQSKYSKYEVRSYLPHAVVPAFCLACRIDPAWLFTGEGKGPLAQRPPKPEKQPSAKRPRKVA